MISVIRSVSRSVRRPSHHPIHSNPSLERPAPLAGPSFHLTNHWRNKMSDSQEKKPKVSIDKEKLKKELTDIEYEVTQEQGTEAPWTGEYLRLKDNGMYACIVCKEELFSSDFKYESGCGWPSFYDVDPSKLIFKEDLRHGVKRTEVTCSNCDAHLGHVFDDGPEPTGKRYCINSVALKFKKSSKE